MIARYPTHVHALSPVLTLQGAVAHSDMPLESGPTLYLPYSHQYLPGYLAWRRDDFKAYFAEHHVQLPLRKGDAGFFNPALFHGAGTNVSADIQRMANLLQVSSAFGRAMEQVDRARVVDAVYPALRSSGLDAAGIAAAVAASAEGYPFPTNLDLDQPVDGLDPGHPGRARAPRAGRGLGAGRADGRARPTTPRAAAPDQSRSTSSVDGSLNGVTTWICDGTLAGLPGSTPRAWSSSRQARRMSARRSWWSTAESRRLRSSRRLSASRSWATNTSGVRPSSSKTSRMARLPPPIE